jgi:hypothetical protein
MPPTHHPACRTHVPQSIACRCAPRSNPLLVAPRFVQAYGICSSLALVVCSTSPGQTGYRPGERPPRGGLHAFTVRRTDARARARVEKAMCCPRPLPPPIVPTVDYKPRQLSGVRETCRKASNDNYADLAKNRPWLRGTLATALSPRLDHTYRGAREVLASISSPNTGRSA